MTCFHFHHRQTSSVALSPIVPPSQHPVVSSIASPYRYSAGGPRTIRSSSGIRASVSAHLRWCNTEMSIADTKPTTKPTPSAFVVRRWSVRCGSCHVHVRIAIPNCLAFRCISPVPRRRVLTTTDHRMIHAYHTRHDVICHFLPHLRGVQARPPSPRGSPRGLTRARYPTRCGTAG